MAKGLHGLVIALATLALTTMGHAQETFKIGVLTDFSGNFSAPTGQGSLLAARMAVEDFGKPIGGKKIEVVSADHQNKPDTGAQIANRWVDVEHVNAIIDLANSSVAMAVNSVTKRANKALLVSGGATTALTGEQCAPTTVHWTFDNYAIAHAVGLSAVRTIGKRWFFVTADFAFGKDLEQNVAGVVKANGGQVLGSVRHPLGSNDFSSFILQAQSSKAEVVALANGGADTTNSIKAAHEFGLDKSGQKLVALAATILDVRALGLETAQGLLISTPFYWNLNEGTRTWSQRLEKGHGAMPTFIQAGVYAATLHYLKAAATVKDPSDGAAVVAAMKKMPTDDPLFGKGKIREDGRKLHDFFLFKVKKPSESKEPWDFYERVATASKDEIFRPLSEGKCSFLQAKH